MKIETPLKNTLALIHQLNLNENSEDEVPLDRKDVPIDSNHPPNLIGSQRSDGSHALILDLDFPVELHKSRTNGHFHLYVDVSLQWEKLSILLRALEKAGIIQKAWVDHAHRRKMTALRIPKELK